MLPCPVCSEPDGQFVRSVVEMIHAARYRQGNVYRCTRCEYEWQTEHRLAEPFHPFSVGDFELTASEV
jgi:hypothetical protein